MIDKVKTVMVSRRGAISLLGLASALGLAVPVTTLVGSNANAQTGGMERRDERREGRQERRDERQKGRQERRSKKKKNKPQG